MKKYLLVIVLLLVPIGLSGAEFRPESINQHIDELFGRTGLYRQGTDGADRTFYKSGTPVVLRAKLYPDSVADENRFILRRPADINDTDFYGAGVIVLSYDSPGGHFRVHYTEDNSRGDAVTGSDGNPATVPQFVTDTGSAFENSYSHIIGLGYAALPGDGVRGGDSRLDVYILNLPGSFGYTSFDRIPSEAYIVIDNDFASAPANLDPAGAKKGDIKVTAAHELFHAFQFQITIDVVNNGWWMEASSTWMEDEIYPEVKDYLNYIGLRYDDINDNGKWNTGEPYYNVAGTRAGTVLRTDRWFDKPDSPLDTYNGSYEYGSIIWVKYLSETMGVNTIKNIWARIGGPKTAITAISDELPATGGTLSSALRDFRKKLLTLEFADKTFYPQVKMAAAFSEVPQELSGSLDHLSAVYYLFKADNVSKPLTFKLADMNTAGIDALLMMKKEDGSYDRFDIVLNSPEIKLTVPGFGVNSIYRKVVLIIMNNSAAADSLPYSVEVTNDPPQQHQGGGGGCFIATAAFGSALAPEVETLRGFRDDHLLTNALGRRVVGLYYRLSPPVAEYIADSEGLRALARAGLYPVIYAVKHPYYFLLLAGIPIFTVLISGTKRSQIKHARRTNEKRK
ncbi:MAG: hypothetical protein HZB33_08140 [Nitrospirae bacterium]|nr:hypothetical protein [Nitrospirota bacterium]